MADQQHRATAGEWAFVKARADDIVSYSCILELLCRIEALEMTLRVAAGTLTPAERAKMGVVPASSLSAAVDRAASEAFRADSWIPWPDEVSATEAKPHHPEKPDSSLERRVSEHIKAQSVLTAALVKRLEALEGVPLDGAVPAKVPGGLPALAEKVKALEDTVNATTQPNHPAEIPDNSLLSQVAAVIDNGTACDRAPDRIACDTIRAVADWMRENPDVYFPPALVFALEQEAER